MPKKGYKQTKQHKLALKANHKGMLGKCQSQTTKDVIGKANRGRKMSKIFREALSKRNKND